MRTPELRKCSAPAATPNPGDPNRGHKYGHTNCNYGNTDGNGKYGNNYGTTNGNYGYNYGSTNGNYYGSTNGNYGSTNGNYGNYSNIATGGCHCH